MGSLLTGFEKASRWLYVGYSMDGFEKLTKAGIANMGALHYLFPSIKGVFDKSIKELEFEKDLLYATQFIGALASCISQKDWTFCLPTKKTKDSEGKDVVSTDYAKILLGLGGFCEAGKFLQKYKVFSFSTCTGLSNSYGSIKLFGYGLGDDIPVIRNLFDKPKDFFVFWGSGVEVYETFKVEKWDLGNWLKVSSSLGKMILITFGRTCYGEWWFILCDAITQNASLLSLVYKTNKEREDRFANPPKFAARLVAG